MSKLILIGIFLLFIATLLIIIGSIKSIKTKTEIAAAGFIGPIPFSFFSNKRMFYISLIFLAVLFILNLILRYTR